MRQKYNGLTSTRLGRKVYTAWIDIRRRCHDPKNKWYKDYGGRGIELAPIWLEDFTAFHSFVTALPNFSSTASIDRVENDKGYSPGNVRWASPSEQVRNRRKNSNNTSGTCGVTWYYNETGGTRAVAWWNPLDGGNAKSKSFPVKKFGLLPAFAKAATYRQKMIQQLNNDGAGYTPTHGL